MTDAHILLVENEPGLRAGLERSLSAAGFGVTAVPDGAAALRQINGPLGALVIDLELPDSDGGDLRQALQALGCAAPVLFLAPADGIPARIAGFHPGEDYVTKPVNTDEVTARLGSLIAWAEASLPPGDLRLDPVSHAVTDGTREVPLTPTEFRLLSALAAQRGRVVRRRDLVAAAWPEGAIVYDNTLDQYVARLRRKLRVVATEAEITTSRGVGYRFG